MDTAIREIEEAANMGAKLEEARYAMSVHRMPLRNGRHATLHALDMFTLVCRRCGRSLAFVHSTSDGPYDPCVARKPPARKGGAR